MFEKLKMNDIKLLSLAGLGLISVFVSFWLNSVGFNAIRLFLFVYEMKILKILWKCHLNEIKTI